MLCEKCGQHHGVIHLKIADRGAGSRERHFCEPCAREFFSDFESGALATLVLGADQQPSALVSVHARVLRQRADGLIDLEIEKTGEARTEWNVRGELIPEELRRIGAEFELSCSPDELDLLRCGPNA